jgi:hypothetical protein
MSKIIHNEPEGHNPTVHSKFDRSGGKGLKPPHLSHPGETAPVTGTHVAGHNEGGSKYPHEGGKKPSPLGKGRHGFG